MALAEGDEDAVLDFAALGATGFIFSDAAFAELSETLQAVLSGQLRCPGRVTGALLRHLSSSARLRKHSAVLAALTNRQRQALLFRLAGRPIKLVARAMGVEIGTVKRELHDAYKTLGVHSLAEVIRLINDQK